jgi:pimeloyl-ACP methyl ester carboxylesterase
MSMPLNWSDNTTQVFVTASYFPVSPETELKGVVWYLNGGSGVGSRCFGQSDDGGARYYNSLGLGLVFVDFRGTGESHPLLSCPDDPLNRQTPSLECAAFMADTWGDDGMYLWSASSASRDLNAMMDALFGDDDVPMFLQGDSFGTAWAQRFAVMFPGRAQRVVAESFLSPSAYEYFNALLNVDWVGRRVLAKCAEHPFCAAHLGAGADVTWLWTQALGAAASGELPCTKRLPKEMSVDGDWRAGLVDFVSTLISPLRDTYAFIPAAIARLIRCDDDDVAALEHMFYKFGNGGGSKRRDVDVRASTRGDEPDACAISQPILYNLFFSEEVTCSLPTAQELYAAHAVALFSAPVEIVLNSRVLYEAWPKYTPDRYWRHWPEPQQSTLYVNGDLDISTPLANAATVVAQTAHPLVILPNAPHVGFLQSPVANSSIPCGASIIANYLATGHVNSACTAHIVPLDFALESEKSRDYSMAIFGVPNGWGNLLKSSTISDCS